MTPLALGHTNERRGKEFGANYCSGKALPTPYFGKWGWFGSRKSFIANSSEFGNITCLFGAGGQIRTGDLPLTRRLLYH